MAHLRHRHGAGELSRQIAERMIALVQRVQEASVTVDDVAVGSIGRGLLIFPGIHSQDGQREADWLVRKCTRLRIFPDDAGQMNLSVGDLGADIFPASQFTLYGNAGKGHRPPSQRRLALRLPNLCMSI